MYKALSKYWITTVGVVMIVWWVFAAWPVGADKFPGFVDTMLKLLAIVLLGSLLPRIASLEFGGAKLSLGSDTVTLAESVNLLAERVHELELSTQPQEASSDGPAPKLNLPDVRFPTDPQRGRFGGKAERDGYVMSATFPDPEGGDLARVIIEVRKLEGYITEPITLFLHDTFKPDVIVKQPFDGVARVELLVWGGFTVGAWIRESPDTLLELNLATVRGAPRIVRER